MQHFIVFAFFVACGGGPSPEASEPPGEHEATEPEAAPRPAPAALPGANCPEGTVPETGSSEKGKEVWCDRNGTMHGPYTRFFPDGTKAVQGQYDNNLPDGNWIWWHENGKESSKGKYNKGKQTGSWAWWYETGNHSEEGDFLRGRKAGTWVSWYDSGMKKAEGIYQNDTKGGEWIYYHDDEENTVWRIEKYQRGQMVEEKVINAPPEEATEAKE